jgi:hypothetical protein
MNVNLDLLSRYADGEATPEEARQVEGLVASDPEAALALDDLKALSELFGHVEPEETGEDLRRRLHAIRPVKPLAAFEAIAGGAAPGRRPWALVAAAAAAAVLLAVGVRSATHRPEVVLHGYLSQKLGPGGEVVATERFAQKKARGGDMLRAGEGERISYRAADGTVVVLMPGGAIELLDALAGDLFELHRGTVLCTVHARGEARRARAAGYTIHAGAAEFGLRLEGQAAKAAGPVATGAARLTVAVRAGSVEVADNGNRAVVEAEERVVLSPGAPPARSAARDDPLYRELLARVGREVIPGYFDVESGVSLIPRAAWYEDRGGRQVLVLTDSAPAAVARYLVLQVDAQEPRDLRVTRVRPLEERRGRAETVTVSVETDAFGIAVVPLDAFASPEAERGEREVPAGRGRLVRLELASPRVKASLWAAHAPAGRSEVIR